MNAQIRILIVDDLPETRENVRKLLYFEPTMKVIAQAGDGEQAIHLAKIHKPDIILMDINMPGKDGISATQFITTHIPGPQVIIMSVQSEATYLRRALLSGARDFLMKPFSGNELLSAINRVHFTSPSYTSELKYTALKNEVKKQEERLVLYKNKLEDGHVIDELTQLITGIAHDLRSPINLITQIIDTLEDQDFNATNSNLKNKTLKRVLYCQWLVDNFLALTSTEKLSLENFNLSKIIEENLLLVLERYPSLIMVDSNIPKDLMVFSSKKYLSIIFLNVLLNAIEAVNGETGYINIIYEQSQKNLVKLKIINSGKCISNSHQSNLFSIGMSNKPAQCGIGLYVARRLIRYLQGDISLLSSTDNSTEFLLYFPNPFFESVLTNKEYLQLRRLTEIIAAQIEQLKSQEVNYDNVIKKSKKLTQIFSHLLLNELAVIESFINEGLQQVSNKAQSKLKKIIKNINYSKLLINNVLKIGDDTPNINYQTVSLLNIIEYVLDLLERKLPPELYKIDINWDFTLPQIKANETEIKQIFMNLIRNAVDAMPEGGTLSIDFFQENQYSCAKISDTGMGISKGNLPNLFKLGFSTKPNGYGIGLFSIKKIIDNHNGVIEVSSLKGKGTSFIVKLPSAEDF